MSPEMLAACKQIDAGIFHGEELEHKKTRAEMLEYISSWLSVIAGDYMTRPNPPKPRKKKK